MLSSETALFELRPRSVRALLEDMASAARSLEPQKQPVVSLFLASGHAVRGRFVAMADGGRDDGAVLMQLLDGQGGGGDDAFYVEVGRVVGVTVHAAGALALDRQRRELGLPPPSRLDLRRRVAAGLGAPLEHVALTVAWERVDDSDAARSALGVLVERVAGVLGDLAAEELGRAALQSVSYVRFVPAEGLSVGRDGSTLTFYHDLTHGGRGVAVRERLRELAASAL